MKHKAVGRWVRTADGKLRLEEFEVDDGPSYASGVSRGTSAKAGTGKSRRGRVGQRQHVPTGMGTVPFVRNLAKDVDKMVHPADKPKGQDGWERAVSIRKSREEKRRKAGLR